MEIDSSSGDESDPIVASYNVFIKPPLAANRRLLVLQHPNKTDAKKPPKPPTEVRLKPKSGMVELDVPLDHSTHYDRGKGVNWGSQLQKSMAAKNGGSHGLAGGFGVHAPQVRGRNSRQTEDQDMTGILDWPEALRQDRVLRTQTLGGQCPEENDCRYMVGVFQGDNLHLTPASSLVHLRPQLHHIDAVSEQERLTRGREGGAGGGTGGTGGGGQGGAGGKEGGSARAIHMTIKSAGTDGDVVVLETMADRLRSVQTEAWQRLAYVDDERDAAWEVYHETLFLEAPSGTTGRQATGTSGINGDEDLPPGGDPHLAEHVDQLEAQWDEDDLLRAVSGVEKEPEIKAEAVDQPAKGKGKQKAGQGETAEKKKPGRPKGSTNTATKTASAKGKGRATKAAASNTVEID